MKILVSLFLFAAIALTTHAETRGAPGCYNCVTPITENDFSSDLNSGSGPHYCEKVDDSLCGISRRKRTALLGHFDSMCDCEYHCGVPAEQRQCIQDEVPY